MIFTGIVTAKIDPKIFKLIRDGVKRYEIRSESFQGAQYIRYVNSIRPYPADGVVNPSGNELYHLGPEQHFNRFSDDFVRSLAAVDEKTFYQLFPTSIADLYAALIGPAINLNELFKEQES